MLLEDIREPSGQADRVVLAQDSVPALEAETRDGRVPVHAAPRMAFERARRMPEQGGRDRRNTRDCRSDPGQPPRAAPFF